MKSLLLSFVLSLPLIINSQVNWSETFIDQYAAFKNLEVADMNGDGSIEFISNDAFGTLSLSDQNAFEAPNFLEISDTLKVSSFQLIDFDIDGDMDIMAVERDGYTMILSNDGSGSFTWSKWSDVGFISARVVDLDLDGVQDLLVGEKSGLQWYIRDNDQWSFHKEIYTATFGGSPYAIRLIDSENDGDMDIIGTFGAGVRLFINDGNNDFQDMLIASGYPFAREISVSDLDGDNLDDILVFSKEREETGRINNKGGNMFESVAIDAQQATNVLSLFADYDGDGDTDILFCEGDFRERNPVMYFLYNEGGVMTKSIYSEDYKDIFPGAVADLDSDGDNDVIMVAEFEGDLGYLYLKNENTTSINSLNELEFSITPTLATNAITIHGSGNYDIYNVNGSLLLSGTAVDQSIIEVSNLPKGVYFIRLLRDDLSGVKKFQK